MSLEMVDVYDGLAMDQSRVSGCVNGSQALGTPGVVGYWAGGGYGYVYPSQYAGGMPPSNGFMYHGHSMPDGEYGRDIAEHVGKSKERGSPGQKVGRFTKDDDEKIVELKRRCLSWTQIAEHFPGRSAGSLQVHYCTKLRRKDTEWSHDMVSSCLMVEGVF